jgi:Domain of unknown function (DUF4268)
MATFGKLELVAIREGWPREDTDFTQWLSKSENLCSLGEEIGFGLELIEIESSVGPYYADILAKRLGSEEIVVIENQFDKSDHDHLGKLLTYAAGVGADGSGAKTIIWIAERFTEPHRAALDWLNKCTEPGVRFFGIQIQLWRIGDSPFAPKFNVISRPNDGQKELTRVTSELTETSQMYQEFWNAFISFCEQEGTTLQFPSAPPQHWLPTPIGRVGFGIHLTASKKLRELQCQLWISAKQAKIAFATLFAERDKIIKALGDQIKFDEMPQRNSCKIYETSTRDVANREEWPAIHRWLKDRGEAYAAFFTPLVKQLKLD